MAPLSGARLTVYSLAVHMATLRPARQENASFKKVFIAVVPVRITASNLRGDGRDVEGECACVCNDVLHEYTKAHEAIPTVP